MNRSALRIARQVADETGTLMAGDISNTTAWIYDDPQSEEYCRQIFEVRSDIMLPFSSSKSISLEDGMFFDN